MSIAEKSIRERRLEEVKNATIKRLTEQNTAFIDYISVMADVPLPVMEEESEAEHHDMV